MQSMNKLRVDCLDYNFVFSKIKIKALFNSKPLANTQSVLPVLGVNVESILKVHVNFIF